MHDARVIGPYEIVRVLDAGGMGTVYLARDTTAGGRSIALKMIRSELERTPEHIEAFKREARLLSHLRHPNIVSLYDAGEIQGRLYIAMEYLEGMDLAKALRVLSREGLRMPHDVAAHIGVQCALALDSAHAYTTDDGKRAGLVHRDLSPHNVFLLAGGGVKILDFGLARAHGVTAASNTGAVKGKFRYLAPEQARGDTIDERVDVFTLGLVLYEMFSGERAYFQDKDLEALRAAVDGKFRPLREVDPTIPMPLTRVVERALRVDKRDRYPSALLLAEDLNHAADNLGYFVDTGAPRRFMEQLSEITSRSSASDALVVESSATGGAAPPQTPSPVDAPSLPPAVAARGGRRVLAGVAAIATVAGIALYAGRAVMHHGSATTASLSAQPPEATPPSETLPRPTALANPSASSILDTGAAPSASYDATRSAGVASASPSSLASATAPASAAGQSRKRPLRPHRGVDTTRRH